MFLDPKNFVSENKADLNDYICPLCNGILFKPVSDKCSHFFCKKCVVSYIKTHKFCPLDKFKELDILKDAPMVERIINNKYIMCKYISYGCSWKGKVKQYQNHLKECEYIDKKISKEKEEISFKKDNIKDNDDSKVNCIFEGCDVKVNNMSSHLKTNREEHELIFQHSFNLFRREIMDKFNKIEKFISKKRTNEEVILIEKGNPKSSKKKDNLFDSPIKNKNEFNNNADTGFNLLSPCKEILKSQSKKNIEIKENEFSPKENKNSKTPKKTQINLCESNFSMNTKEHSAFIELLGKRVRINGSGKEKKFRFAFADVNLNISSWKWKIKVIKLKDWAAFGACFKDEIISSNYKYTKPLNHSTFVISSNGYVWNCLNEVQNGKYFDFLEINEGDELEFHYDNVNQKLICKVKKNFIPFKKNHTNIKFHTISHNFT